MADKITLTVTRGSLQGRQWTFAERDTCLIGRHEECSIQLPNNEAHKTISRHHALLDINPPQVRIRDFGSLNGTFVNSEKIGSRARGQSAEEGVKGTYPERDLCEGDEIRLGDTAFRVAIERDQTPPRDVAPRGSVSDVVRATTAGCG